MHSVVYKLPLLLEPQPEGGYTITCPLLPNLMTEADTLEEVMPNVADALAALLEAYEDLQQPLPPALQPLSANMPLWTETLIPVASKSNTDAFLPAG
jgi:antitoxin HicB